MRTLVLLITLSVGCTFDGTIDRDRFILDDDGDGVYSDIDCNDNDAESGAPSIWYEDSDVDGVGNADSTTEACEQPVGYVATAGDCDENNSAATAESIWYVDCDGDGVYDAVSSLSCGAPTDNCAGGADPATVTETDPESYDCDDVDADYQAEQSYWLDCDGDGGYAAVDDVCNPTADEGDCLDGEAPDDFSPTDPGVYDCDDSSSYQIEQTYWLDCDGDGGYAAVDNVCNPTVDEGDCADGEAPDSFSSIDPGVYDCDDGGDAYQTEQIYWLDCDGDGGYAAVADVCNPTRDEGDCADGEAPDDFSPTDPGTADCDDSSSYREEQSYWFDCDGDSHYVVTADVCNPTRDEGDCFDGAAPDNFSATDPEADDCDDTDGAYYAEQSVWLDCDGDSGYELVAGVCNPTVDESDCDDGEAPDSFSLTDPGVYDCDDGSATYHTEQSIWLDCDGDLGFALVAGVCNPTVDEGDCDDGEAPDRFQIADPGVYDCDDSDATYRAEDSFWFDCDGDSGYTLVTGVCNPTANEGDCDDGAAPDSFSASDPGVYDCDDASATYHTEQSYWLDCDGDSGYALVADVCNPTRDEGDCDDGAAPDSFSVADPGVYDCDDASATYHTEQSYWLDCDGDSYYVSTADVCNPTVDEGDCDDGLAPDNFSATDPSADDCDDTDGSYHTEQAYWLDCDGDDHYVTAAGVCNPTAAEGDCDDGEAPDNFSATDPSADDCDDTDVDYHTEQTYWLDCDGDSFYVSTAGVCNPTAAEGDCDDGLAPDNFSATDPSADDCDDTDIDYHTEQTYWLDCDGDSYYLSTASVCNPTAAEGDCADGLAPDNFSATDPSADDCDDTDIAYHTEQSYWLDCDDDDHYVTAADVCNPTANEGDCDDGEAPDNFSATDPSADDCDDTDIAYHTEQSYWLDCDDDDHYVTAADVCNPTANEGDCDDGEAPDNFSATDPSADDCDDTDIAYHTEQSYWLDCDDDDHYVTAADVCNPTANEGDCDDGEAPDNFSATDPSADDCDDTDIAYHTEQSYWLDCDDDDHYVTAADVCNPTANEGDCDDGEAPDNFSATDPSADDCDDTDGAYHTEQSYWLDCDDDDHYVTAADVCNPTANEGDCDDGEAPDNFSATDPSADDCDDTDSSGTVLQPWFVDCDGDSVYALLATADVCLADGVCAGGADPNVATTSDPGVYDCDDTDVTDVYCDDCSAILALDGEAADGIWPIGGDDSAGAIDVYCDMTGGGWINLELTNLPSGQRVFMSESGGTNDCDNTSGNATGNPWCKCFDDSAHEYDGYTEDIVLENVTSAAAVDLTYSSGGTELTVAHLDALRAVIGEMAPDNTMVAVVSDDDTNEGSGHEAYIVDYLGVTQKLTTGENGNCGGLNDWPLSESLSAYWFWHTDPNVYDYDGQFTVDPDEQQLSPSFILPDQVILDAISGGGVSFGWEKSTIQVRAARASCNDILFENATAVDGLYYIDPDGDGPFLAYCDMTTDLGGWTLLGTVFGGDTDNWNTEVGYWGDLNILGDVDTPFGADFKSEAWYRLDVSGAEIMYERRYDTALAAQMGLGNACLFGVSQFYELFTDWNTYQTPCAIGNIRTITAGESKGVRAGYLEGIDADGLGGSGTNGWCWSGGDNADNTFRGHAGWNQSSATTACEVGGHLGYIALWESSTGHSQYALVDIDDTNWLNDDGNVDNDLVGISFWAR